MTILCAMRPLNDNNLATSPILSLKIFVTMALKTKISVISISLKSVLALLLLVVIACGCGSNKEKGDSLDEATLQAAEERNERLARALNDGQLGRASEMADSMSLIVDDLTPEQTIQVLLTFLSVHNEAVERKETRRDLETLRKYVDVYDIALSVNPSGTRDAFKKARKMNPAVDFDSIATSFRERLAQYDAIQDGSLIASEPEPADSAAMAADSLQKVEDIPLELRPAE